MRMRASGGITIALLAALVGCEDSDPGAGSDAARGDGGPSPDAGGPPDAPRLEDLDTTGIYDLTSPVDITASALFPQPVYQYYDLLRQFRDDPGGTLIAVLEDAGGPALGALFAAIPDSLEGRLAGFINDYVQDAVFQDSPVSDELQLLFTYAETTLARLDLVSELELVAPSPDGRSTGRHLLLALRFHVDSEVVDIPVPADPPPPFSVEEAVAARVLESAGTQDARLELGDHGFGVAYGELAWAALEEAVRRRWGGDVRATLGLLMDCPAMAADVAGRCVLSVCVGHAPELEAVCEAGLDELVARLQAEFESLRFDAVHLASGSADLYDAPLSGLPDGRIDRIVGGVWDATIDFGMDPRRVPATFSGSRRP